MTLFAPLEQLLGERLSTSDAIREQNARNEAHFPLAMPDAALPQERPLRSICCRRQTSRPMTTSRSSIS